MSVYKRSPQPFVPPIPPDVTSSSESSPVLQSQHTFPSDGGPPTLGRPGQHPSLGIPGSPAQGIVPIPGYGYPAFTDYSEFKEFQEYQQEVNMNGMGMMQRYQQQAKRPGQQQPPQLRSPGGPGANMPLGGMGQMGQMAPRGFYGGGPPAAFGYAPAAPQGYGFSPYPQPSPYPYTPAAGGFAAYGGGGAAAAAAAAMFGGGGGGYMSPYMSPMAAPGLLDPVQPPAPQMMGGMARPGGGGGAPTGSVIGRPGQQQVDMAIGKWFPGPDYAPVLDHLSFNIVKPPVVEIHPLLRPISETRDSSDPFLVFDILFPPNTIHVSTEPPRKSWSKGRKDPATFPRLKVLRIVSRYTPWVIQVTSDSGITVSDVIQAVHDHFRMNASEDDDWNSVEPATQSEILMAYKWNRSTEMGAPGGIMPEALLRGDFLMERTMFAGIKLADPDLTLDKMDVKNFPATFELLLHTR